MPVGRFASSLEKRRTRLFKSSAQFKMGGFVFFLLNCTDSLHNMGASLQSDICLIAFKNHIWARRGVLSHQALPQRSPPSSRTVLRSSWPEKPSFLPSPRYLPPGRLPLLPTSPAPGSPAPWAPTFQRIPTCPCPVSTSCIHTLQPHRPPQPFLFRGQPPPRVAGVLAP